MKEKWFDVSGSAMAVGGRAGCDLCSKRVPRQTVSCTRRGMRVRRMRVCAAKDADGGLGGGGKEIRIIKRAGGEHGADEHGRSKGGHGHRWRWVQRIKGADYRDDMSFGSGDGAGRDESSSRLRKEPTSPSTADASSSSSSSSLWSIDSTAMPESFLPKMSNGMLNITNPKQILQLVGALIVGPLVVSAGVRLLFIEPGLRYHASHNATTFELTQRQRMETARRVEEWERNLRYNQIMGRAEKMSESELEAALRAEAELLEGETREKNIAALSNVIADITLAAVIAGGIASNRVILSSMKEQVSRIFFALGASQQAVLILLVADILVGYHSSDGWVAFISLLLEHYGINPQGNEAFVSLFVATVPVLLDVSFKYWVFSRLRRLSPSTQVILDELERH